MFVFRCLLPRVDYRRRHEPKGRGIRAAVRAVPAETRDARGGRVDLPGGAGRTHRMGRAPVHPDGHEVLVAVRPVLVVDIPRPVRGQLQQDQVRASGRKSLPGGMATCTANETATPAAVSVRFSFFLSAKNHVRHAFVLTTQMQSNELAFVNIDFMSVIDVLRGAEVIFMRRVTFIVKTCILYKNSALLLRFF